MVLERRDGLSMKRISSRSSSNCSPAEIHDATGFRSSDTRTSNWLVKGRISRRDLDRDRDMDQPRV